MAIRDLEIVQLSKCTLSPDMHTSIQVHLCFQSQFSIDIVTKDQKILHLNRSQTGLFNNS